MATTNPELLRRLRAAVARAAELELAELDRQLKEHDRASSATRGPRQPALESEKAMLRAMQQAKAPMFPREIASRLDITSHVASRWLAASLRRGYVERIADGRYQVTKEVPPL